MALQSLIKPPTLTRELSHELSSVGGFIRDEMNEIPSSELFMEELDEFDKSSSKLRLFSFPMLFNDFEGLLIDTMGEDSLNKFRKSFRLKFPYLSALDQMSIFFMPADKQPCAISCFFLSEILSRIMDVHGQSKRLKERFQKVMDTYRACRFPQEFSEDVVGAAHVEVMDMPQALFGILSPSLGQTSVLNLYQRTYDKLQSQYSSLPSFVFLQKSVEKIFRRL